MITDEQKQQVLNLLRTEFICVASTIGSNGFPESAALAFTTFDDLTIAFQTPNTTRKYKNLQTNAHVSIVVGWDVQKMLTVQYEGEARELTDEQEINKTRMAQLAKNPASKKYAYLPENKYFVVTPKWLRYTDLQKHPTDIFEVSF